MANILSLNGNSNSCSDFNWTLEVGFLDRDSSSNRFFGQFIGVRGSVCRILGLFQGVAQGGCLQTHLTEDISHLPPLHEREDNSKDSGNCYTEFDPYSQFFAAETCFISTHSQFFIGVQITAIGLVLFSYGNRQSRFGPDREVPEWCCCCLAGCRVDCGSSSARLAVLVSLVLSLAGIASESSSAGTSVDGIEV